MPEPENDGTTEVVFADLVPGAQDKLKALGLITYDWQDEAGEFVPAPVQVYSPEDWQVVEAAIRTPGVTKERVDRARHIKSQLSSSPTKPEPAPSVAAEQKRIQTAEENLAKLDALLEDAQQPGFYSDTETAFRSLKHLQAQRDALAFELDASGPASMVGVDSTDLSSQVETSRLSHEEAFDELQEAIRQHGAGSAIARAADAKYKAAIQAGQEAEAELARRGAYDKVSAEVNQATTTIALAKMQAMLDEEVKRWQDVVDKSPRKDDPELMGGLYAAKSRALHPEKDPRYPDLLTVTFLEERARLTGGDQQDSWRAATRKWEREQREHNARNKGRLDL